MLEDRCDEGGYKAREIVPIPTKPWPSPKLPPCYFPQKSEPTDPTEETGYLRNITLRDSWLGTRPIVNKYSITKYSPDEWRQHNAKILEGEPIRKSEKLEIDTKNCITHVYGTADKEYSCTTGLLKKRAHEIYQWKCETEYCIKAMADEITSLEELRQRFKSAIVILEQPESIAKECLQLRSNRIEIDLVWDGAEEQLVKELALITEIRRLYNITLTDMENQLKINKAAKDRMEFDWSDKIVSYSTDTTNIGIHKQSDTILMKSGSVRIPEGQSSMDFWVDFSKTNMQDAEISRQESIKLRKYVETMLLNTARDLRSQGERVDQALAEKASCTDELRIRLESELKKTLQKLVENENLSENLRTSLMRMELSLKIVQTRLDNRLINGRPNVEYCKDIPQHGLIEEAKSLMDCIKLIKEQLMDAKEVKLKLLKSRSELEKDIMIKKKSLSIDKDRCKATRSFYPSASKLSGYN